MESILSQLRQSKELLDASQVNEDDLRETLKADIDGTCKEMIDMIKPGLFLPSRTSGTIKTAPRVKATEDSGSEYAPSLGDSDMVDDDASIDLQSADEGEHNVRHVEDSEDETRHASEYVVVVNGKPMHIWDYLGKQWSAMIETLHSIQPLPLPPNLSTTPDPWQDSGSAKLSYLGTGPFGGGILGDEQGLGKSLTTLITCEQDNTSVKGCFNLILTTRICGYQWFKEIVHHFQAPGGRKPRPFILTDPHTTVNELLEAGYDYVICTYQFVHSRHKAMLKRRAAFKDIQSHGSLDAEMERRARSHHISTSARSVDCLFSPVYRALDLPFKHLILDEVQYVKNPEGQCHRAIKDLFYNRIYMLSGTFLPNKWFDVYGSIDFLKGHPFTNIHLFRRAFARNVGNKSLDPTESKRNRLVKFLQAIVISRPVDILNLPGLDVRYHGFSIADKETVARISYFTRKFFLALARGSTSSGMGLWDVPTNDRKRKALLFATLAQQLCANPCLLQKRHKTMKEKLIQVAIHMLDQFLEQYEARNKEGAPAASQTSDSELAKRTRAFALYLEAGKLKGVEYSESSKPLASEDPHVPDEEDPLTLYPEENKSLDVDEDFPMQPEDTEDPHFVPNHHNEDEDEEQEVEGEDSDFEEAADTASAGKDRREWLQTVHRMDNSLLLSPKIKAEIELIKHVRITWPKEKIVIFSKFLKFLDLLDESIRRDSHLAAQKVIPLRFDGTTPFEQRPMIQEAFSSPPNDSPILVTPGPGGAGMNLQAATIVIISEPWWTASSQEQAFSRAFRKGQDKKVIGFIMRGEDSVIDFVLGMVMDKKAVVNDKIMKHLRRVDEEAPQIPRQFRYGVGEG